MKRWPMLPPVLARACVAVLVVHGVSTTAMAQEMAEACTSRSGDVNADGLVDLSDGVTVLGYLFLGNPLRLVPLCEPGRPLRLPSTGQTRCFDDEGNEIPCDDTTCPGQDGFYKTGCPPDGRFVDNGDGTVSDTCTGLMWQKDTADTNGDGKVDDSDDLFWCEATSYFDDSTLGGYDDWRLPNIHELGSIVDYGPGLPTIDPVFRAEPRLYWSSTGAVTLPGTSTSPTAAPSTKTRGSAAAITPEPCAGAKSVPRRTATSTQTVKWT